ncbi:MAG: 1-(5-phosphoribosyl)-5-[(5-phosphoribosylamino) methylideneamino]imidazole-4-carboxamide isomerase [Sandaracinaceae bacterium]
MSMELVPAIDLLGGRVVRLRQGDYADVTVYAEDAVAEAARFRDAGAARLHVVDLEGARGGPLQLELVERIVRSTSLRVQVGGGIRSAAIARRWLDVGADRVVVGTAVVREPEWVRALAGEVGARVVAALDARDGEVRVGGWLEGTGRPVRYVARECDGWGVGAILFTDIGRDGTGNGPAVEATAALQAELRCDVIASGGIGTLEHLRALARAGVRAAVCGRALYDGAFDYASGVRAIAEVA